MSSSNANTRFTYDLSIPTDESINIIKMQNKKIADLYKQIDLKDLQISKLYNQIQLDNVLKEENQALKEKIEKINNDTISEASNKERLYQLQMENIKNSFENELNKYCDDIKNKNDAIQQLQEKYENSLKINQENLIKINNYEKSKSDSDIRINDFIRSEQSLSAKAKELVEIIKKQGKEIHTLEDELSERDAKMNVLAAQNERLSKEVENNIKKFEDLQDQNQESENIILSFNDQLKEEKNKNFNLSGDLNKLNNELSAYKVKLNNALSEIKDKKELIDDLTDRNKEQLNLINQMKLTFKEYTNNISNSINYFCSLVTTSIKWGTTYIGNNNLNQQIILLPNECNLPYKEDPAIQNLSEVYLHLNDGLTEIFKKISFDFDRYEHCFNEGEHEKIHLQSENDILKKKYFDLSQNLKKFEDASVSIQCEVKEKSNMMEGLKEKLGKLSTINDNFDNKVNIFYDKLIKITQKNEEKFKNNTNYQNIFKGLNIMNPISNSETKFEKAEEISLNFAELSICLIEELDKMKYNITQYESINLECQQLRQAILDVKKGYSNKRNEIQYEKEKILSEFQKNKTEELNKIQLDYTERITALEKMNKEKEEEIEKLNHDNNLLYSQYLLSEKNFNEYKNNRKDYDQEIQRKYEELNDKFNYAENERNKILNENNLLNIKVKKLEDNANYKTEENEKLKQRINELTKNSII